MDAISRLIEQIDSQRLLVPSMFEIDRDEALDSRGIGPFDAAWNKAHSKISENDIDPRARPALVELREAAYLRCYELTHSADVSGYVSDDFGLIGTYLLLGKQDDWVNALWLAYRDGQFPSGILKPQSGRLEALIE